MMARCTNPNHPYFPRYGARGITVCDEWRAFPGFLQALGTCPPGHQLARLDTSKGYTPENTRWLTRSQAMRIVQQNRGLLQHAGQALPLIAWSEKTGIPVETIRSRLRLRWTVPQALGFEPR
jgi:hypothetical protein